MIWGYRLWFGIASAVCFWLGTLEWRNDSPIWALFLWVLAGGSVWHAFLQEWYEDLKRRRAAARYQSDCEVSAQRQIVSRMQYCDARTAEILRSINRHLSIVGRHLDAAEREFAERAYTPFWIEVESATTGIGNLAKEITEVAFLAEDYANSLRVCDLSPPPFQTPLEQLPKPEIAKPLIERLDRLVRQGHKDFQFATIYEQRRTTRAVTLGLEDLRAAIAEMSSSIERSLQDLEISINRLRHTTESGLGMLDARIGNESRKLRSEISRIRRRL